MGLANVTGGTLIDFGTWRTKEVEKINKQRKKSGSVRKDAHLSGRAIDLNVHAFLQVRKWAKTKGHLPEDAPDLPWTKLATPRRRMS